MKTQNDYSVELENDDIPELLMFDLVESTPKPATRVALVDEEGYEEKVKWEKPEDASEYLSDLVGFGEDSGRRPIGLPDSEEFSSRNIRVEAEAGETLRYEVEVEGLENATGGYLCRDGDGNEYISSEDGAYRLDDTDTSVVFSAETSAASQEKRDEFEEVVRRLEEF